MKSLYTITAFLLFGLFFFINIFTLNDGHNWGDDFAQYIQHAINLVEHKPYASKISWDLWVVYPPGFPLLLSSMIYWFGVNFKILKCLNVLLWALSALAAYGLALKSLDLFWARMIAAWFLTSSFFFFFKQNVLSDIPFMCFVLLAMWTFMKFEDYQQKGFKIQSQALLWLSIFCMSYALLIRWAGISLFLAVILYYFVIKRDWKASLSFILGAVIACFIALQYGASPIGYFDKNTVSHLREFFGSILYNSAYALQMILTFFISSTSFAMNNNWVGLLFLGIMGLFFYRLYLRKISFMGCFTFIYLGGVILWPIHEGPRFLLPVIIPITIYSIKCFKPAWRKLVVFIFLFLIFHNVFAIASDFRFNDDDIFQRDSLEMLQWVDLHINPEVNYMFSHPRALGFITHRIGYSFGTHQAEMRGWYKRIKPLHINYLIADKRFDQFSRYNNFRLRVDNYELYINVVWENNLYKIFNVVLPVKGGLTPHSDHP